MNPAILKKNEFISYSPATELAKAVIVSYSHTYNPTPYVICLTNTSVYTTILDVYEDFNGYIEDKKLTLFGMAAVEKSLHKEWENEDDEHWASFIKD